MEILVASLPAYGHLYPIMPLALAFREAGHRVRVAAGSPFLDTLPLETVPGIPAERGAARVVHNDGRRPGDIGAAVSALLGGGPENAVTSQLAAEIAAAPAVSEVADALVGIVSGHPTGIAS